MVLLLNSAWDFAVVPLEELCSVSLSIDVSVVMMLPQVESLFTRQSSVRSFLAQRPVRCVFNPARAMMGRSRWLGPLAGPSTAADAATCQGLCAAWGGNFSGSGVRWVCVKSSCKCSGKEHLFASKCNGSKQKTDIFL